MNAVHSHHLQWIKAWCHDVAKRLYWKMQVKIIKNTVDAFCDRNIKLDTGNMKAKIDTFSTLCGKCASGMWIIDSLFTIYSLE